ncbi:MAG TPA: hypothetical protein VGH81_12135 [Rudaea sp.]|jgi:hypothetical protein
MYMRAVTFRVVYVGIVSVGILLTAAFRQSNVQATPIAAASRPAVSVVKPPIVILPTVEVRSVAIHASGAKAPAVSKAVVVEIHDDTATGPHAGTALTLRLDMPYYSFGKVLPRVGKE